MRALSSPQAITLTVALALAGCAIEPDSRAPETPGIALSVAPLELPGIGFACYDALVENEAGEPVWSRGDPSVSYPDDTTTLCSTRFGNGTGGDISYVGPCDASQPGHTVTLWVDGLYDANGADLGDYQNPCPAAGCTATVGCAENADTPVVFNLTVMRAAQQGFFDVAVNFDNIFCSAKFDTCYPDGEGVPTTPITLLHGPDGQRRHTGVAAVACAGGEGDTIDTTLHMAGWFVGCNDDAFWFYAVPYGPEGRYETTSYHFFTSGQHPTFTLHFAQFYGQEALPCGDGSCHKVYWNFAFDLQGLADQGLHDCYLYGAATASRTPNGPPFEGTSDLVTTNTAAMRYPLIRFGDTEPDAGGLWTGGLRLLEGPLSGEATPITCGQSPLNGPGSRVWTAYTDSVSVAVDNWWPSGMCFRYASSDTQPAWIGLTGGPGTWSSDCDGWATDYHALDP